MDIAYCNHSGTQDDGVAAYACDVGFYVREKGKALRVHVFVSKY